MYLYYTNNNNKNYYQEAKDLILEKINKPQKSKFHMEEIIDKYPKSQCTYIHNIDNSILEENKKTITDTDSYSFTDIDNVSEYSLV